MRIGSFFSESEIMFGVELFNTSCSLNSTQGQNSCGIFDFWPGNYYTEFLNHSAVSSVLEALEHLFSGFVLTH